MNVVNVENQEPFSVCTKLSTGILIFLCNSQAIESRLAFCGMPQSHDETGETSLYSHKK
jgi:hypothetical protein